MNFQILISVIAASATSVNGMENQNLVLTH